jgi:hypothetical protein
VIEAGLEVEHFDFGIGKVVSVLGDVATVEFFGEELDVEVGELRLRSNHPGLGLPPQHAQPVSDLAFRKVFEAVNLGVVPADPERLVNLTIGGEEMADDICHLLEQAPERGLCRVYMGYYGSGKSHHLRVVRSVALRDGWVTASVELDPKAADPAKPSTVYEALTSGLEFPTRTDGSRSLDFFDLVKEIRDNWTTIRSLSYVRRSPWFSQGLKALLYLSHRRDDSDYVSAVNWLAGQMKQIRLIRSLSWRAGYREKIPTLPQVKDTGIVYAYNLVVLHEIVRALGYKGLVIIIDEAEHVRTYSFNRYARANNFFDVLARCAHRPRNNLDNPDDDYEQFDLPPFWREGPHFALFVGLTEGEDTRDLRRKVGEMGVLIHDQSDVVRLSSPDDTEYEKWVLEFLEECGERLGPKVQILVDPKARTRIAGILRKNFVEAPVDEQILRNWTKLAGFGPAVLLSHSRHVDIDELAELIDEAARQVAGEVLPWEG